MGKRKMTTAVVLASILAMGVSCARPAVVEPDEAAMHDDHEGTESARAGGHHHHESGDHPHGDRHDGQGMHHGFDDPERWSKVFDNPERDAWQMPDAVVAAMQMKPGMTVADIGAGTGYFLSRLAQAVGPSGKVLALDVEPSLVEHMRERAAGAGLSNVEAKVVDPADPGLPPASVDRILIVNTWHHIADRSAYAAKLARALKPGGELHVVDFDVDSPRGPSADHKLAPDAVIEELRAGGFEARTISEPLPDQYVVVGTVE